MLQSSEVILAGGRALVATTHHSNCESVFVIPKTVLLSSAVLPHTCVLEQVLFRFVFSTSWFTPST